MPLKTVAVILMGNQRASKTREHGTVVALRRVKRQQESKAGSPPTSSPTSALAHNRKTCLSRRTIKSVKFEHAELTKKPRFCYKGNKASGEERERESRDGGEKDFSVMREKDSAAH